jgi:hypothetical protein
MMLLIQVKLQVLLNTQNRGDNMFVVDLIHIIVQLYQQ